MTAKKNILAICGSTRSQSANNAIIETITKLGEEYFTVHKFDISILPYFNQDATNQNIPGAVLKFRNAIEKADGVLICTPEYVFSLPGILKNAIEWTVSTTVFSDKPTVLITASSSGEKAHESLLLVMNTLGVKSTPEMGLLISGVKSKLNTQSQVIDPLLQQQLETVVDVLANS
ncbi:MAG: NADPH-dependent FMN reductase [Bacteroidota bacterium]